MIAHGLLMPGPRGAARQLNVKSDLVMEPGIKHCLNIVFMNGFLVYSIFGMILHFGTVRLTGVPKIDMTGI